MHKIERVPIFVEEKKRRFNIQNLTLIEQKEYTCGNYTYNIEKYLHEKTQTIFAKLPAGTFIMGSDAPDSNEDEKPLHSVNINSFFIAETPITQEVWTRLVGTSPWKEKKYVKEGGSYPATYISWHDTVSFCAGLI